MTVRIGFVGAGGITTFQHLPRLARIDEAEVVAFSDVNGKLAREVAEANSAAAYTDWREMLGKEKLDAVYVCVPPFAHGEIELACIERGLALFIEKPIALDVVTAEHIRDAVGKAGVACSVGYVWRYMDAAGRARELLAGRRIALMHGRWIGSLPPPAWWKRKAQSGGQLHEQTTHPLDCARFLAGSRITSAYARGFKGILAPRVEGHDVEDASAAVFSFESGAVLALLSAHVSPALTPPLLEVVADGLALSLSWRGRVLTVKTGKEAEEVECESDPFLAENEAFVKAVATGDASGIRSPYADAVETLRASLAANESMETGRVVGL